MAVAVAVCQTEGGGCRPRRVWAVGWCVHRTGDVEEVAVRVQHRRRRWRWRWPCQAELAVARRRWPCWVPC